MAKWIIIVALAELTVGSISFAAYSVYRIGKAESIDSSEIGQIVQYLQQKAK